MGDYRSDRTFSDKFTPQIKAVVGPLLLEPAPMEMDISEATDFVVFCARDMRIAARVRKPGYFEKYPWEFTLRSVRESGAKTELAKIIDGWGDWLFYAHAKSEDDPLAGFRHWMIVDLDALRAGLIRVARGNRKVSIRCGDRKNNDGTGFKFFDVRTFPPDPPILVGCSERLQSREDIFPLDLRGAW